MKTKYYFIYKKYDYWCNNRSQKEWNLKSKFIALFNLITVAVLSQNSEWCSEPTVLQHRHSELNMLSWRRSVFKSFEVNTLHQFVLAQQGFNQDLFICYVDFPKAFDSVRLLESLYKSTNKAVRVGMQGMCQTGLKCWWEYCKFVLCRHGIST